MSSAPEQLITWLICDWRSDESGALITLKLDVVCGAKPERERVTVRARRANLLRFLAESSSIGFLRAVISRKVIKYKTMLFFSFLIGATDRRTQIGMPVVVVLVDGIQVAG